MFSLSGCVDIDKNISAEQLLTCSIYSVKGEEDVNEVLLCPKVRPVNGPSGDYTSRVLKDDKDSPDWVKNYSDDLEKLNLSNEK